MKKAVSRRQRLVRVRDVLHTQAVAESARARGETQALEANAARLRDVRAELFHTDAMTSGAALAGYRELAMRLESAGRQLDGAIYDAKRRQDIKDNLRIVANRDREIAERLKDRAVAALEAYREQRLQALPRPNRKKNKDEVSA